MPNPVDQIDEFDPATFIDRLAEQELFARLMKFEDAARLLAIQDASGKGKSTLLRRLEYTCRWELYCPVALISLDQLPDPSIFGLVTALRDRMKELSFNGYDLLNAARVSRSDTLLTQVAAARAFAIPAAKAAMATAQGALHMEGANISGPGATFAETATVTHIKYATINMPASGQWGPEHETLARDQCVRSFFEDVKTVCEQTPVAILLDSWEGCNSELKPWIKTTLLRSHCFDEGNRPSKLVIVIAGREPVMDFKLHLGEERFKRVVRSISSLGAWEVEHVKEFLAINNVVGIDDSDAEYICGKLRQGWPLLKALNYVKEYLRDEKAS